MAETANALADLRLTRREADAFRPAQASPYRRATWGETGNALLSLGRMLLPPTPNEYVWGLSGLAPPPPGAEVRSGVDGYGAEYRMPGGEWRKMEPRHSRRLELSPRRLASARRPAAWMRQTARNDPEIRKRIALNSAAATAFGIGASEAD